MDTTNRVYEFLYKDSTSTSETPLEIKIKQGDTLDAVKIAIINAGKQSIRNNAFTIDEESEIIEIYDSSDNLVDDVNVMLANNTRKYYFKITQKGGRRHSRRSSSAAKKRVSARCGRGSAAKKRTTRRNRRNRNRYSRSH